MGKDPAKGEAASASSHRPIRHSLTYHTLIAMGIRVTLVVLAVSLLSYWHIVDTLEEQTYDKLQNYIEERADKESTLFKLAESNHQVFKEQFLLLRNTAKDISDAEFESLYQKMPDGSTRMRPALFTGVVGQHDITSQHNSSFVGADAPLDSQEFRNRLVYAYRLLDRFGPAFTTRFVNLYAAFPENAITVHWSELAWGSVAEATMNVHQQEWFYVSNTTNNPQREPVWTGIYYDQTALRWMVSSETPVDVNGKHILTVGQDYPLDALFERVFKDHLNGAYNFIFREDGRIIAHPDKVNELRKANGKLNIEETGDPLLLSQYRQIVKTVKDGDLEATVFLNREKEAFLAVSKIAGPGWWFVTYYPKELLSSSALKAARFIFALSVISLIIELLMLYFVLRFKVVGPLKQFVHASTEVEEGHYDAVASGEYALPETRDDEVGLLARGLRVMASTISDNIKQMKQLDRLKDDFMANTSHELRTPLNGIVGIAESMLDGAAGELNPKQAYNLSLVVTSGQRLTNLVNDILDFSQLKHQELNLQIKAVDIGGLVDIVVVLSQPLIGQKKLQLLNQMDEQVPLVYADEDRIQQILYNLIGNAIKFTNEGTVAVSSMVQGDHLVITVTDTGIGISANQMGKIFQSFEQADGSTERSYGGTGLGLAVTKQLIELHNGQIWVESSEGQGSGFSFTLPLCKEETDPEQLDPLKHSETVSHSLISEPQAPQPEPKSEVVLPEPTTQGRVLIVDDEPINIQVLQNHLSLQNYQICTAANGQEAIEMIENNEKFDAVLLDVMMPGMTGFDVCRHIRKKYPTNQLPILMVTAKNRMDDLVTSFGSGANDFLTKPVSKVELLERVKTQINVVRLNDDLNDANLQLQQHANELESEVFKRTAELQERGCQLELTNKKLTRANLKVNKTAKQMLMLEQLGRYLTSTLELDKVIENIHQIVNNVLDAQMFMLGILETEKNRVHVPLIVENQVQLEPIDFELDDINRPAVWCVQNKKELVIMQRSELSQYFSVDLPVKTGLTPETIIYQPLMLSERVIGCLSIQNSESNAYSETQIEMVRTLASYAAIALANALGFARLQKTHHALKDTQQQLVLQEKMASLGTLTAGVAHEINNPTNFVHVGVQNLEVDLERVQQFILDLAGDEADEDILESIRQQFDPLSEHMATVKDGTGRIKTIVADLRAFTRLDDSDRKPANMTDCLESTINLAKTKYLEVATFSTYFQPTPELMCYPAKLNQVFMNLIVNGCDAIKDWQTQQQSKLPGSKKLGKITIGCQLVGNSICVTINDDGCGMSVETKNKLFEPFYTTKPVGEGTGLGMAISFGIIEDHNGTIEVESAVGEGTTITVKLPVT